MKQNFSPSTGTPSSANFILTSKLYPLIGTKSSVQIQHDMTISAHLPRLKKQRHLTMSLITMKLLFYKYIIISTLKNIVKRVNFFMSQKDLFCHVA